MSNHHLQALQAQVPEYLRPPQPASPAPREATVLEQHARMLDSQHGHLCSALNRLTTIIERLLGPVPADPVQASPPVPEYPMAERIGRMARELTPVIEGIHEQINRLERL